MVMFPHFPRPAREKDDRLIGEVQYPQFHSFR